MTTRHLLIIALFATGASLTVYGLIRFFHARKNNQDERTPFVQQVSTNISGYGWRVWLLLILIIGIAFTLRIESIDLRGMTHVEVYVPGIPLPENISEPPPRIGLKDTVIWHWHAEPHPQAYYLIMWGWTKLFGADLEVLRLPSVLFSLGTIVFTFLLASRLFGVWVGLASALLLALNGHQIYWSQLARMYGMATFLAVVSTYLLVDLLASSKLQRSKEIAYTAITCLGVYTQIFFWPFLAGQMLFTAWYSGARNTQVSRVLKLQAIVAMLGAPMWAHAVYTAREIVIGHPTLEFLQQFLTFAFLFQPDTLSLPAREVSILITAPLTIIAVYLLFLALRYKGGLLSLQPRYEDPGIRRLIPISVGMVLVVLALAWSAWRRNIPMAMTALVPLLALLVVPVTRGFLTRVRERMDGYFGSRKYLSVGVALLVMCCFVPTLLLYAVALWKPLIMDRGFLLLTPSLIILLALGLRQAAKKKAIFILLVLVLGSAHLYSIYYYRTMQGPRAYRATAEHLLARIDPTDLIFVHKASWITTPLFYHLQGRESQLVAEDFTRVLQENPEARVWIPLFSDQTPTAEMLQALHCLNQVDEIVGHRSRLRLYIRANSQNGMADACK